MSVEFCPGILAVGGGESSSQHKPRAVPGRFCQNGSDLGWTFSQTNQTNNHFMQRAEEIPLGPVSQSGKSLKQAGEQLGQGWLWRAA